MELILGNSLSLNGMTFQNHDLSGSNFLPFGFSGAVINRNGDNITATLAFPNTALTRPWASQAIDERWIAVVDVYRLNTGTTLYRYTGQVSAGGWDEVAVKLELSTVLDAVGSDVPFRSLSEDLVGPLPTSSGVRVF